MPEHGIYLIGLCFQFAMSFFAFIHHLKYSIMKNFMDENFLLQTETAQKLYHEHAAKMPIIDYLPNRAIPIKQNSPEIEIISYTTG